MKDEGLNDLKIEIEKAMAKLSRLQQKHSILTGRPHVMPAYTMTPDHLRKVRNDNN